MESVKRIKVRDEFIYIDSRSLHDMYVPFTKKGTPKSQWHDDDDDG